MKKERRKRSQENIHTLAANTHTPEDQNIDSGTERTETEDQTTEEDEDGSGIMDAEDSGKEGPRTKGETYRKDMYKALDGSALMAIGSSTNFDSEVGSTYCRHCIAGIRGTHTLVETLHFRGTSGPETEKNRTITANLLLGCTSRKDNRMECMMESVKDAYNHYFDDDEGADTLLLGPCFKMYSSVKVPSSHRFKILFR